VELDDGSQFSSSQVSSGVATPDGEEEEEESDVLEDVAAEVEDHEARTNCTQREESKDGTVSDESSEPNEKDEVVSGRSTPLQDEVSDLEDSDYASPEIVRTRLASTSISMPATAISESGDADTPAETKLDDEDDTAEPPKPKMGKAAQKRAKKAAAAATSEPPSTTHTCATCNVSFPSRTQLFQHITKNKHAAFKSVAVGGVGNAKKGKAKK